MLANSTILTLCACPGMLLHITLLPDLVSPLAIASSNVTVSRTVDDATNITKV